MEKRHIGKRVGKGNRYGRGSADYKNEKEHCRRLFRAALQKGAGAHYREGAVRKGGGEQVHLYTHYQDLYDLADQLETQVAADIVAGMRHPETVFSDPGAFNRELVREYVAREELIHLLFSGSRASLLPGKIEQSLKELIFSLRPDLKDNAAANVFFTIEIYGGFYAFEKCRAFGVDAVVEIMTVLNEKIAELLR